MTEVVFGERVLLLLLLGLGRLNLLALPCFWMTPVDWAGGSAPFRGICLVFIAHLSIRFVKGLSLNYNAHND